ncbi:DUF3043 domain-containing protein [Kocuria soli]|uniref:DUF3043 domain-containing protein n=1 Tax=Kocuria soli TaxID=2485125 RepID=A0A3N3ZT21_9MICC|nr:DUF3043 domain-containing protein [Kocuria soli]ROZ64765.1 DUF3043 domain-containing protein [Kocuria soli]
MFGRNKKTETETPVDETTVLTEAGTEESQTTAGRSSTQGKGRPTPTRRQQQAARKQPLVPKDRKAAKVADRQQRRDQRLHAQQRMAAGDQRYLAQRDRGDQRAFVRDWVDSRFCMAELLMPMAVVALVFLLIPSGLQEIVSTAFFVLFAVVVLDCILLANGAKRAVRKKFGTVESGTGWYAVTRSINWRSTRLPRPRVRRGQRPS